MVGHFFFELFKYELEEHVDEYIRSKIKDGDMYFFAVTEHSNDVAMLLIDEDDHLYTNEDPRDMLRKLWKDKYYKNIEIFLPQMVEELSSGYLFTAGVKMVSTLLQ